VGSALDIDPSRAEHLIVAVAALPTGANIAATRERSGKQLHIPAQSRPPDVNPVGLQSMAAAV
jgi:hypothetical protein